MLSQLLIRNLTVEEADIILIIISASASFCKTLTTEKNSLKYRREYVSIAQNGTLTYWEVYYMISITKKELISIEKDGKATDYPEGAGISVDFKHPWTGEALRVEGTVGRINNPREIRVNTPGDKSESVGIPFEDVIDVQ
jgi:hypothetical protein